MLFAAASSLRADTAVLNIVCGYLYDGAGTAAGDRLPPDTLCMLVADIAGDGFDAPDAGGWTAGDDVLVTIIDTEHPPETGGTKGFDLSTESTGSGVFSRTVAIDLAQFGGRTSPVPVALRWFPAYKARQVNLSTSTPAPGSAYGEFHRVTPLYPEAAGRGWFIPPAGDAEITFDPCITVALGLSLEISGLDPELRGSASLRIPGSVSALPQKLELVLQLNNVFVTFQGGPGQRYEVQRSTALDRWDRVAQVAADAEGEGRWRDATPPAGRSFYRVRGPLP